MEKEEFIKQRCEIDDITEEEFEQTYRVIECNCGKPYCNGYRCLDLDDLYNELKKQQEINKKAIEYIKSKENGKCIHNGIEKGAYTFVLDFDKAREFIWELLEILEDKEV